MPELAYPDEKFRNSYIEALREGFVRGDGSPMGEDEVAKVEADFAAHVASRNDSTGTVVCPDGVEREKVPYDTFWLVEGEAFIGEINLRHELNDFLTVYGGHVGYGVRPSRRRQGLGSLMLELVLPRARELGIDKLLLTCDPENAGSRGVIEANGGVLEKVTGVDWADREVCHYWITL